MTFDDWKQQLVDELYRVFQVDGEAYIRNTGEGCWREAYDDGLTPREAAEEEAYAAASML